MSNTKKCRCGACPADVIAVRAARGFVPFCELPPAPAMEREGFGSYEAAAAARRAGQRIRSVGGLATGSPSRFVLIEAAK